MYEEQELTMQVFSEPDIVTNEPDINVSRIYLLFISTIATRPPD